MPFHRDNRLQWRSRRISFDSRAKFVEDPTLLNADAPNTDWSDYLIAPAEESVSELNAFFNLILFVALLG